MNQLALNCDEAISGLQTRLADIVIWGERALPY